MSHMVHSTCMSIHLLKVSGSIEPGVYIEQAWVCLQILTMGMPSDTDSK